MNSNEREILRLLCKAALLRHYNADTLSAVEWNQLRELAESPAPTRAEEWDGMMKKPAVTAEELERAMLIAMESDSAHHNAYRHSEICAAVALKLLGGGA